MIHFLADLTTTGVVITLIVVMLAAPVIEVVARRKLLPAWLRADDAVVNYISMLTVFYGLLLGLVAIDLWQKQDAAEANTIDETNQIRILFSLSSYLPGDHQPLTHALDDYTQGVIKKEWPIMLTGHAEELFIASPELDLVRDTVMDLEPKTFAEQDAFQQMLTSYTLIVEARQKRLLDSERNIPVVLWLTLILGAVFIWISTWFIPSERPKSQVVLSSIASGYLFLLFYLIVVLEHPFIGAWRVDFTPYQRVLELLH